MFLILLLILSVILVGCSFQSELSTEKPHLETEEPSIEQMKADLIGHILTWKGQSVWKFAALSEYKEFDVIDKQKQGNAVEYDVSMRLKDLEIDAYFEVDALIVYKEIGDKWELVSIVTKLFERVRNMGTY